MLIWHDRFWLDFFLKKKEGKGNFVVHVFTVFKFGVMNNSNEDKNKITVWQLQYIH